MTLSKDQKAKYGALKRLIGLVKMLNLPYLTGQEMLKITIKLPRLVELLEVILFQLTGIFKSLSICEDLKKDKMIGKTIYRELWKIHPKLVCLADKLAEVYSVRKAKVLIALKTTASLLNK